MDETSPCTRSMVNTGYERIASCAVSQFRTRSPESHDNSATHYCAECTNHSATSSTEKRIPVTYETSSKLILDRNDCPLGCLPLALVCWYYFCKLWCKYQVLFSYRAISMGKWLSIIHPYLNKISSSPWQASIRVASYEGHGVSTHR